MFYLGTVIYLQLFIHSVGSNHLWPPSTGTTHLFIVYLHAHKSPEKGLSTYTHLFIVWLIWQLLVAFHFISLFVFANTLLVHQVLILKEVQDKSLNTNYEGDMSLTFSYKIVPLCLVPGEAYSCRHFFLPSSSSWAPHTPWQRSACKRMNMNNPCYKTYFGILNSWKDLDFIFNIFID